MAKKSIRAHLLFNEDEIDEVFIASLTPVCLDKEPILENVLRLYAGINKVELTENLLIHAAVSEELLEDNQIKLHVYFLNDKQAKFLTKNVCTTGM